MIGSPQTGLHPPEELEKVRQSFRDGTTRKPGFIYSEFHALHRSGLWIPVEISTSVLEFGGVEYAFGIFRDISERKKTETLLRELASEREQLIKEVLHRSKNNLALVSSLLCIQMQSLEDPETRKLLRSAEERIQLMVELQEMLYETELFDHVPLDRYLRGITSRVIRNYRIANLDVLLDVNGPSVEVEARRAINIGLIVNELLTNAMKYAFPDRERGVISIDIDAKDGKLSAIQVTDDGIGMDADAPATAGRGLGMTLVYGISEQIDVVVTRISNDGTRWTISFPEHPEGESQDADGAL